MSENLYAPPQAALVESTDVASSAHEQLRRDHVGHELQLKAVGLLYYLSGAVMVLAAAFAGFGSRSVFSAASEGAGILSLFYLLVGMASIVVGWGFRRLLPWVRIPGGLLAAIGLLSFPFGTAINGLILYMMFGRKGRVVLSPSYQAVILATPHIRYQRTLGDKIALGILITLVIGVIVLMVFALAG